MSTDPLISQDHVDKLKHKIKNNLPDNTNSNQDQTNEESENSDAENLSEDDLVDKKAAEMLPLVAL